MTSLRGFLEPQLSAPPRLTQGQKGLVLDAARAVLEATLPAAVAAGLLTALQGAVAAYPTSTACSGCVHLHAGTSYCQKWKDEIPPEFLAAGCREWTDDEVPF